MQNDKLSKAALLVQFRKEAKEQKISRDMPSPS